MFYRRNEVREGAAAAIVGHTPGANEQNEQAINLKIQEITENARKAHFKATILDIKPGIENYIILYELERDLYSDQND